MRRFETIHRVSHSAERMFALVADVERYPDFVPLCVALNVRSREARSGGQEVLIADMSVAYKMFRETFTSRVTLDHADLRVLVEYIDGPFRHLENRWQIRPLDENACEIDFFIAYEFASRSMQILMGAVFERAFAKFVGAFEARADQIYGRPSAQRGVTAS